MRCWYLKLEKWKMIVDEGNSYDRSSQSDVSPAELRIGHIKNEDDETVLGIVVENKDIRTSLCYLDYLTFSLNNAELAKWRLKRSFAFYTYPTHPWPVSAVLVQSAETSDFLASLAWSPAVVEWSSASVAAPSATLVAVVVIFSAAE